MLKITSINIIPSMSGGSGGRLLAMADVVFDDSIVVKEFRIINGPRSRFVAPPTRPLTDHCPICDRTSDVRARYCTFCGTRLADDRAGKDEEGRPQLYRELVHPINEQTRRMLHEAILSAYDGKMFEESSYGTSAEMEDLEDLTP